MPFYFAYGANLDREAMARRCPGSRLLGPARLEGWRFIIMDAGYATVLPDAGAVVHGLLWNIAYADLPALDGFEEVDAGLYRRTVLTIVKEGRPLRAAVYLAASTTAGMPVPGYMEMVLASALACSLPDAYCAELRRWLAKS